MKKKKNTATATQPAVKQPPKTASKQEELLNQSSVQAAPLVEGLAKKEILWLIVLGFILFCAESFSYI